MKFALKNIRNDMYLAENGYTRNRGNALQFDNFSLAELRRHKDENLVTVMLDKL